MSVGPNTLRLAQALRDMFDMNFSSRAWEDLPDGERERWIECANELKAKMRKY